MSHASDARQFKQRLEDEGYDVLLTGSGHYEVQFRGERVATFPKTPGDRRWKKNAVGDIRRWKRQADCPR